MTALPTVSAAELSTRQSVTQTLFSILNYLRSAPNLRETLRDNAVPISLALGLPSGLDFEVFCRFVETVLQHGLDSSCFHDAGIGQLSREQCHTTTCAPYAQPLSFSPAETSRSVVTALPQPLHPTSLFGYGTPFSETKQEPRVCAFNCPPFFAAPAPPKSAYDTGQLAPHFIPTFPCQQVSSASPLAYTPAPLPRATTFEDVSACGGATSTELSFLMPLHPSSATVPFAYGADSRSNYQTSGCIVSEVCNSNTSDVHNSACANRPVTSPNNFNGICASQGPCRLSSVSSKRLSCDATACDSSLCAQSGHLQEFKVSSSLPGQLAAGKQESKFVSLAHFMRQRSSFSTAFASPKASEFLPTGTVAAPVNGLQQNKCYNDCSFRGTSNQDADACSPCLHSQSVSGLPSNSGFLYEMNTFPSIMNATENFGRETSFSDCIKKDDTADICAFSPRKSAEFEIDGSVTRCKPGEKNRNGDVMHDDDCAPDKPSAEHVSLTSTSSSTNGNLSKAKNFEEASCNSSGPPVKDRACFGQSSSDGVTAFDNKCISVDPDIIASPVRLCFQRTIQELSFEERVRVLKGVASCSASVLEIQNCLTTLQEMPKDYAEKSSLENIVCQHVSLQSGYNTTHSQAGSDDTVPYPGSRERMATLLESLKESTLSFFCSCPSKLFLYFAVSILQDFPNFETGLTAHNSTQCCRYQRNIIKKRSIQCGGAASFGQISCCVKGNRKIIDRFSAQRIKNPNVPGCFNFFLNGQPRWSGASSKRRRRAQNEVCDSEETKNNYKPPCVIEKNPKTDGEFDATLSQATQASRFTLSPFNAAQSMSLSKKNEMRTFNAKHKIGVPLPCRTNVKNNCLQNTEQKCDGAVASVTSLASHVSSRASTFSLEAYFADEILHQIPPHLYRGSSPPRSVHRWATLRQENLKALGYLQEFGSDISKTDTIGTSIESLKLEFKRAAAPPNCCNSVASRPKNVSQKDKALLEMPEHIVTKTGVVLPPNDSFLYLSKVVGVVWDKIHNSWVVNYTLLGRRYFQHFPAKRYGFLEGRQLAIELRLAKDREKALIEGTARGGARRSNAALSPSDLPSSLLPSKNRKFRRNRMPTVLPTVGTDTARLGFSSANDSSKQMAPTVSPLFLPERQFKSEPPSQVVSKNPFINLNVPSQRIVRCPESAAAAHSMSSSNERGCEQDNRTSSVSPSDIDTLSNDAMSFSSRSQSLVQQQNPSQRPQTPSKHPSRTVASDALSSSVVTFLPTASCASTFSFTSCAPCAAREPAAAQFVPKHSAGATSRFDPVAFSRATTQTPQRRLVHFMEGFHGPAAELGTDTATPNTTKKPPEVIPAFPPVTPSVCCTDSTSNDAIPASSRRCFSSNANDVPQQRQNSFASACYHCSQQQQQQFESQVVPLHEVITNAEPIALRSRFGNALTINRSSERPGFSSPAVSFDVYPMLPLPLLSSPPSPSPLLSQMSQFRSVVDTNTPPNTT